MNTHDKYELPPLPAYFDDFMDRTKAEIKAYARAAIKADRQHQFETSASLERYLECGGDEEPDPIERLRFFCSISMLGQDWLDVERFFDDVIADRQRRGVNSTHTLGEPVGYIMPTALKQLKAGGNAIVGGVSQGFDVPIYTAPQPAEPVKANDWLYDAMCATSHLDYESGAPHEVCQALRVLRAALNNEPYDAYLSVPLGPTHPAEPEKEPPCET